MTTRLSAVACLLLLLALAACNKSEPPKSPDPSPQTSGTPNPPAAPNAKSEEKAADAIGSFGAVLIRDEKAPGQPVVEVRFFNKDVETATKIMLHVHQHGIGECGVFTYEVAETKVTQVMDFARKHQHPLQCVMEKK